MFLLPSFASPRSPRSLLLRLLLRGGGGAERAAAVRRRVRALPPLRLSPRSKSLAAQLSRPLAGWCRAGGAAGRRWGGLFVCFFYCLAKSLFIVRKTRSVRSLLLLPAARARRRRAKRSGAPIHTDTGWEMSVTPPPPNSHRSHSVTPQSTALLSRSPRLSSAHRSFSSY